MSTLALIQLIITLLFLPSCYILYKKCFIKKCRIKQYTPAWLFSFFIVYNLEYQLVPGTVVLTILLIILGISQLIFKCDK